ncbi:MAG: SulP family sulfate permease, partial [Dinoroseobacter sp.]
MPDTKPTEAPDATPSSLLGVLIGGPVIGVTSIVLSVSFIAIVYTGPLAPYLDRAIAHTLLGAIAMYLIGAALFSFKGAMSPPQDVTAILLATGVSALYGTQAAANPDLFAATIAVLVPLAALGAGVAALALGYLRLGTVVRYVPFQVIAGFLAATGYLLALGGISMTVGENITLGTLHTLFTPERLPLWAPWAALGLGLAVLTRNVTHDLLVPCSLIVLFVGLYVVLPVLGISLQQAMDLGLLLGPFEEGNFLQKLDPTIVQRADWGLLAEQIPLIFAVMALTVLGTVLNITGLEKIIERDLDTDSDLRATGWANLGAGLLGGMPGFQSLVEPMLAKQLHLGWRWPSLFGAAFCTAALVFGATAISWLPIGVFAAVVAFLGFDLLLTWLKDTWGKISRVDYAVILGIVLVAATAGFLWSLLVGLIAAVALFLITYAQIDIVRARSTLAVHRSRVERPVADLALLAERGTPYIVLQLDGFLFFGTAHALREKVKAELAADPCPIGLVIDFGQAQGTDMSALQTLTRIATDAQIAGVALTLSNMDEGRIEQVRHICDANAVPLFCPSLDAALQRIEEEILSGGTEMGLDDEPNPLLIELDKLVSTSEALAHISVAPEAVIIRTGSDDRDLFLLRSGRVRAEITLPDGSPLRVALFQPGAMIGEMAHYAGVSRTADIVAETQSELLRIDVAKLGRTHPNLASRLHSYTAKVLARRVISMTALVRNAGL